MTQPTRAFDRANPHIRGSSRRSTWAEVDWPATRSRSRSKASKDRARPVAPSGEEENAWVIDNMYRSERGMWLRDRYWGRELQEPEGGPIGGGQFVRVCGHGPAHAAMKNALLVCVVACALHAISACAGPGRSSAMQARACADQSEQPEVRGARICDIYPLPVRFHFRCRDAAFSVPGALGLDNAGALDGLFDRIRQPPGLERIILHGQQSSMGPEREMSWTLSQERAESVGREIAARGYPWGRISMVADGYASTTAGEPDLCPPPAEDTGHPHRSVTVQAVVCLPPAEFEERAFGWPLAE
jgi:hypothetical protein